MSHSVRTRPTCVASEYGVFDDVETFIERKTSWRSASPGVIQVRCSCRFILPSFLFRSVCLSVSLWIAPSVQFSSVQFALLGSSVRASFVLWCIICVASSPSSVSAGVEMMALLAFLVVGLFCFSVLGDDEDGGRGGGNDGGGGGGGGGRRLTVWIFFSLSKSPSSLLLSSASSSSTCLVRQSFLY